jgi:hypothetical protein
MTSDNIIGLIFCVIIGFPIAKVIYEFFIPKKLDLEAGDRLVQTYMDKRIKK